MLGHMPRPGTSMSHAITPELQQLFRSAPFIADLGIELEALGSGSCMTALALQPRHLQQHGVVHAGVLATLADHTAGAAASSLMTPGRSAMTVEFKINFLRAARGERLVCRSQVLKPGSQFAVAESEVYCRAGGEERLVAKAMITLAVVGAS